MLKYVYFSVIIFCVSCGGGSGGNDGTAAPGRSPEADFEFTISANSVPLSVHFSDISTGAISSWQWDFDNDGTIDADEQNPSHVYTQPGIYTVSLKVTGSNGSDTEIKLDCITAVAASSPVISSLDHQSGPCGSAVRIVGSNFGTVRGQSRVTFGGVAADSYPVWSDSLVVALVPENAQSGDMVITTESGSAATTYTITSATTHYVSDTGRIDNPGTWDAPFLTIQQALDQAGPGDWVLVREGTFSQELTTRFNGDALQGSIVLAGFPGERVAISRTGRLLNIDHDWFTLQDIEFNSNFGGTDAIRTTNADHLMIKRCIIYNAGTASNSGGGDGIDIEGGSDILIDGCEIFDCLSGDWNHQLDSHGIVAGNFNRLTIRGCKIYRCTGDAIQADPDYDPWDNLIIESCELFTNPMPLAKAGWNQGEIPGENGFDSKADPPSSAQSFVIRDCDIYGFNSGWITNQAALNIKKSVNGIIERCTIYNNEIAFRMREPAQPVTVQNCVIYNNAKGVRYEDGINDLNFLFCTFINNTAHFTNGGGGGLGTGLRVRNCLFENAIPSEASFETSNIAINTVDFDTLFVDSATNNYQILDTAVTIIDQGDAIALITDDRDGNPRPAGSGFDVGAYEFQ